MPEFKFNLNSIRERVEYGGEAEIAQRDYFNSIEGLICELANIVEPRTNNEKYYRQCDENRRHGDLLVRSSTKEYKIDSKRYGKRKGPFISNKSILEFDPEGYYCFTSDVEDVENSYICKAAIVKDYCKQMIRSGNVERKGTRNEGIRFPLEAFKSKKLLKDFVRTM